MTSYGCTVLKKAYKPAVRVYSDDNSSMKTYKTFDFRMTGDSLDYLLEKYLQNHLAILLESKGFERADSPDFFISRDLIFMSLLLRNKVLRIFLKQ